MTTSAFFSSICLKLLRNKMKKQWMHTPRKNSTFSVIDIHVWLILNANS